MKAEFLDRPLCLYYLWKITADKTPKPDKEEEIITTKQALGQLKAERSNLEKMNDPLVFPHILSLAIIEEKIKNSSEDSFRLLQKEVKKRIKKLRLP